MLTRSLRRLESEIRASELRLVDSDQRAATSLRLLRHRANRAFSAKLIGGAALIVTGWLLHRPRRRHETRAPRAGRVLRGARLLGRVQRWLPLAMPLLTPLLSRRSALLLGSLGLPVSARADVPLRTVPTLDLDAFSGLWFEIARLPRRGETPLRDVSLYYSVPDDGGATVRKRGLDDLGKLHEDIARLRVPDPHRPGEVESSRAPEWLAWWPGAWSDHWVIYADAHYTCALVGSPERDRLLLLARQPSMPDDVRQSLFTLADRLGFDTTRMRLTPHA
jgi:apolipoprotein D and lipocalin family protein